MPTDCITYQDSGYFTPLIVDYLNQKPEVQQFYSRFPLLENFAGQIAEKQQRYAHENRAVLVEELGKQYAGVKISELTRENISLLAQNNTFTVTTGHQLNLFTGPLYFLYKIISAINLAKELGAKYPENHFVPVYWMATEDHDFEEINYFNFRGKKFRWNRESAGAVGRLSTEGLDDVLDIFAMELGPGNHAQKLKDLFKEAYLSHTNLADATRFLANELFGEYGIVIIDADAAALKKTFIPYIKSELEQQVSFGKVSETIAKFGDYTVQVNPREINLFYLDDALRERFIFENGKYFVNNTALSFTKAEIFDLAEKHPEKFSPNVITRPLYQEVLLPNLCYIGGGGEIAYWLELKSFFEAVNVTFPVLLIRNSVLLSTEKQARKADRLQLGWRDLFMKQNALANKKIRQLSEFPIDLSEQKKLLSEQFQKLHNIALQTDKSFIGAVKAQEVKQTKGLENLEKRLLKAQKRKHADELERITDLQNALFPFSGLQERTTNFSEFYAEYGNDLIKALVSRLKPFDNIFEIVIF
ncbi:bacillithiol biosynthesis cysteine-adding enzyme BshC [Flavobacterium pallidum]|uniref:Putative cysteine ligase BshC n=1 Tax=Flavobacterium pallidum TaxID=2172098 RepID=A0A2S1SHP1_9FLAO|nr:bacillithiol biosynthesis cysteine-adding enzyme BshC [Flavobacterium pallidum]AWI25928.1 bacillithiol biosynthesis cysteine-adding enzyme BshC [Flavobacterium pallidum]